jgi:hypothetical protein
MAGGARFRRPEGSKPRAVRIWEIIVAKTTNKQVSKIQQQKAALRKSLWPNLDEKTLWAWQTSDGWLNVPRAMPLLLQIMDRMSNGKPVSATYLDLWCRTWNDSFVVASTHRQMAFHSGFTGERAEHTWASRVRILADLGFIDVKSGPSGVISYILIWNPYLVVRRHWEAGRVDERSYNALLERMIEIGASDLEATAPEAA